MKLTMLDYVRMANNRLRHNLACSRELTRPLVDAYLASGVTTVRLIASGSSRNAALCARNLMQSLLGVPVMVVTPEAYVAFEADFPTDAFDVVISQSGYSTNSIAAIDYALAHDRYIVALTGNVVSPMAAHGCPVIDYGVGVESVDFVTMGVQTLVAYLMLFAAHAAAAAKTIDAASLEAVLLDLAQAIDAHAEVLRIAEAFAVDEKIVLSRQQPVTLVGNGPNFGVVQEAALKFNETLKLPAMFFEGEEFIHGPEMRLVPGDLVFLVDDAEGSSRMANTFVGLSTVTDGIYFLTSHPRGLAREVTMPRLANPLMAAIPNLALFQYVAAQKTEELGRWDVHPYLEALGSSLGAKAAGYEESVKELEAKAASTYGNEAHAPVDKE